MSFPLRMARALRTVMRRRPSGSREQVTHPHAWRATLQSRLMAVAALFAAVKTAFPIRPVSFEPPQQVVNTTSKGSKLETEVAALDINAPVVAATKPEYLDVTVPAGKTFTHRVPREHTVFAYVFEGSGVFGHDREVGDRHLVSFDKGDVVIVSAKAESVRFLLVSGQPIGEPIAWQGPIVMNTDEELRIAFAELENDTFIKHRGH